MKQRYVATAIIKKGEKYLFIKKKEEEILRIPGGAIETNEKVTDALKREIMEECGITITNIQPIDFFVHEGMHDGEMSHTTYLRFLAEHLTGKPIAGDDAEEIHELTAEEIIKTKQHPKTIEFLKKLKII